MSLFRSSVRPPAILSDEAVARYLASIRNEIDPDPAFRRRLRGVVVNQFVAARELGVTYIGERFQPVKTMGRLGRAVLYASFALGVGVTGVMAASESSVPGDVLYALKRAIEDARLEVLPPAYHDQLVAYEINERVTELATLVDRGDEARVAELATAIATEYEIVSSGDPTASTAATRHQELLATVIARLPADARVAVTAALDATAGPGASGAGAANGGGSAADPSTGGGSAGSGGTGGSGTGGEPGTAGGDGGEPGTGGGNGSQPGSGDGGQPPSGGQPANPGEPANGGQPGNPGQPATGDQPAEGDEPPDESPGGGGTGNGSGTGGQPGDGGGDHAGPAGAERDGPEPTPVQKPDKKPRP